VFTGQDGKSEIGIGSGVVQDSRADNEYEECLLKLKFVTDPLVEFELIETLRFIAGEGYALLGFHMQRLSASAMRLGFNCDVEKIEAALLNYAYGLGTGAHRVRLTLARSGHYQLISQALQPRSGQPFRFVLAETPMDPASLFLYHKTTNRSFYDDERNRLAQITGCDEAVFLNVRGELTEGSFTNLFLEKEGTLLTPALQCGLLPGTLRQDLLNRGKVCEAILTVRDLQKADAIWLGNSVRGLLRAQWLYQGMQAKSGVGSIQGGNRIS
jgi:para-aminobenzoate synthetase/4-amino-4-deoxychorismate lyase